MKTNTCISGRSSPSFLIAFCMLAAAGIASLSGQTAVTGPLVVGGLNRDVFINVPGITIEDLTASPKFPGQPDIADVVTAFETPSQSGDQYGERLTGYLLPPVSGEYVFYLASDDQGALYLSRDARPINKFRIAFEATWSFPRTWTGLGAGRTNSANISSPIYLQAGRQYYVEALHKEGGGGDNFGVAWRLPAGTEPEDGSPPIEGQFLARIRPSATNLPPVVVIEFPTNGTPLVAGSNLVLRAYAFDFDGEVTNVQFSAGAALLGRAVNVLSSQRDVYLLAWTNPPPGNYTLTAVARDSNGLSAVSDPVAISIGAAPLTVTSLADSGPGSLRQVVADAPPGATVTFAVTGTVYLTQGQIALNKALRIHGPGAQLLAVRRSNTLGTPACRIFETQGNPVAIEDITIADGILSTTGSDDGGGIENRGVLVLNRCVFSGNQAWGESSRGGGICNHMGGRVTVNACTFLNNSALDEYGEGGAIYNYGYLAITNSTFYGNKVGCWGGAIHNDMFADGVFIDSCTFIANEAATGAALFNNGADQHLSPIWLRNSIITGNSGEDIGHCSIIQSGGYNLIGSLKPLSPTAGRPFVPGPGDRLGVAGPEVHLGPLQLNGGATPTLFLLRQSLAINAGPEAGFPPVDQRGVARPFGGRCDVGAVEANVEYSNTPPVVICPDPAQWQSLAASGATGTVTVQVQDADGDTLTVIWAVDGVACLTNTVVASPPSTTSLASVSLTLRPGMHTVAVSVSDGLAAAATCSTTVEVLPVPPLPVTITRQPSGQVAFVGQPATFRVEASGTLPLSYQWLFNGGDMPGATNSNLTLSNAEMETAGTYRVRVSNGAGSILSVEAILTVLPKPSPDLVDTTFRPAVTGRSLGAIRALAVLPDGKILIAGDFEWVNGERRWRLARLFPDGSLDPGFNWPLTQFYPNALALQPDGKILVGGTGLDTNNLYVSVLRLNADGTIDPGFKFYGAATNSIPLTAMALQPDGRLIVSFITCCVVGGNGTDVVARLNPDGSRDTSFEPLAMEQLDDDSVHSIALQPDGKVLIGGYLLAYKLDMPPYLARLNSNGSIDSTFRPQIDSEVRSVVVQPNGRILIAGWFTQVNGRQCDGIARLNPDGTSDSGFNTALWPGSRIYGRALALLADGSILLAGDHYDSGSWWDMSFVTRLSAQGVLDPSFLVDFKSESWPAYPPQFSALVIQPDGQILVGGQFGSANGVSLTHLARLRGDLPITPVYPSAPGEQRMPAVAANDQLYLVAWADRRNGNPNDWDIYAARITPDGQVLDPSGIAVCTLPGVQDVPRVACDGHDFLVVWEDGRGLLSGGTDFDIYGARVTSAGKVLDPNGFPISRAARAQSNPSVAWNGSIYLAAWQDQRNATDAHAERDIYAARISASGVILDPAGLAVSTATGLQWQCNVAACNGDFLVAWSDFGQTVAGLYGTRVTAAGTVIHPDGVQLGAGSAPFAPAMAVDALGYLVVWDVDPYSGVMGSEVIGRRLPPSGEPVTSLLWRISSTHGFWAIPGVAASTNGFLAVWMDNLTTTNITHIWGMRLPASGPFTSNVFEIVSCAQPLAWNAPAISSVRGDYLVAWVRQEPTNASASDIFVTRVTGQGNVLDRTGIAVSTAVLPVPTVTWSSPSPITYGTRLSHGQLNAVASVPGTFTYSPPVGTILKAGLRQTLTAVFTPLDTQHYAGAIARVAIDVTPAALTIYADDKTRLVGQPNPSLTASYMGFVAGDGPGSLEHPVEFVTTADTNSPPGVYPISPQGAASSNYTFTYYDGALFVCSATNMPGSVDLAFDAGLNEWARVQALARQPDGKILIGGWFTAGANLLRTNLARLNADGTLDPTFDARVLADTEVFSIALQPDGKMLVGSPTMYYNEEYHLGLVRLNPDGTLDPAFHPGAGEYGDSDWGGVRSITPQPDGKILIGGMFSLQGHDVLARLNPDGTLDTTFNAGNIYVWEGDDYVVRDLLLQPDGKILVRGDISEVQGMQLHGFFRLHPDGTLDEDFDMAELSPSSIFTQPDGKILVGSYQSSEAGSGLVRLNADGSSDPTFHYVARTALAPSAMAVQTDSRILAAGQFGTSWRFRPVRLSSAGELDPQFDCGAGANATIRRMLVLPDGTILVAGDFSEFNGVPRSGLVRLSVPTVSPSFVTRAIANYTVRLSAQPSAGVNVYAIEDQPPAGWAVINISDGGVFDSATGKVKFGPFFDHQARILRYDVLPPLGFVGIGRVVGQASADGVTSIICGEDHVIVGGMHPADMSPGDWAIRLDELTAYAAAWRTGGVWSLPPIPIPIDYVTRAVALWRGGETYTIDPGAGGPPSWWVNATVHRPSPLTLDATGMGSAIRQLPAGYVVGESIPIGIDVTPQAAVSGYAVEETLPVGAQITNVNLNGQIDPARGTIRWGPFLDSTPRALRYELVLPPKAGSSVLLKGVASFDGYSIATGGRDAACSGSRLSWGARTGDNRWTMLLKGDSGATYVLETSTNLVQWTPVATFTNVTGSLELPMPATPQAPQSYYRARLVPWPVK